MNPLVERKAKVTVEVTRDNADGEAESLKYEFEQHRMSIVVSQGGKQYGNAKVQVFGLPLDQMNQIARLWLETLTPSSTDTLSVDVWDGQVYVPFFKGAISWSAVNAARMPQVALEIEANDAMAAMLTPASPYSQEGPISLKDVLTTILEPAGFVLEYSENAPDFQPVRVRVAGTPLEQAAAVMNAYPELTWYINLQRFIVRPVNGPLGGDPIEINKTTGMVGYPVYSTTGITVATIFNPKVRPGLALDVQTEFDFVNRTKWVASVLQHTLEPNTPGGAWLTQIAAQSYGSKGDTSGSET